jgi:hypothetical protein
VVTVSFLSVLYLMACYPSSASFADLRRVDPELSRLFGVEVKGVRWKEFAVAFLLLSILSFMSPVFLVLLGGLLVVFAASNGRIPGLLEAVKMEAASLPLDMREVSYRLRRGEPLESALSAPGSLALRAVKHGVAGRLFPEMMFSLLGDVVESLRHSGMALADALEELRVYVRELLNYRAAMNAQLESARGYLFLLYILLPVLSLFSIWAFDFIAQVGYMGGGASPYYGFEGFSLVSKPPELETVLGFVVPSVFISMVMLTVLSVLCEEVIAPQLLAAKTGMLGVGAIILGIGGIILTA